MRFFLVLSCIALGLPVHAADPRVGLRPAHGVLLRNRILSISPPVIQCGKTTRVSFAGRDLGEALDLWHSLPPGNLKAVPVSSAPGRVVMDVSVSPDAPVGVCGVRVATRDGLTNAAIMMVDDLPEARWGTFLEGTVDRYPLTVAAGERVSFEVVANRLGHNADPLLVIRDSTGRKITERDNSPGLYFDLRFEHRFEKAGTYSVEVRDARYKASEHHHYVLRMGRFPAGRVAVPSAIESGFTGEASLPEVPGSVFSFGMPRGQLGPRFANFRRRGDQGSTWVPIVPSHGVVTTAEEFDALRDRALSQAASGPTSLAFLLSPGFRNPFLPLDRHLAQGRLQATSAVVPGTLCGVLREPGRVGAFHFHLHKGQRIFVRGEARSLNSPVDLDLSLVASNGRELRRSSENIRSHENEGFDFTAPSAGDYALLARDAIRDGGDAFAYRIEVRSSPFPPRLAAEVEGLTVPRGTYQPIPIIRAGGSPGSIQLHLVGGPPGLKLSPTVIAEKEQAVVCRLEADAAAPLGVHTVQIVGEWEGPNGPERFLVFTRPLIDMKWQNVDLIPLAPREDQTRLPPSLADRFAVQITPESPFTFDLPQKEITLPRYQAAAIPVATTRAAGFDGPIAFAARGGQLAEKTEGRTRVYAEFPPATRESPAIAGRAVSKILSNTGKTRIEVVATGRHQGRIVDLIRTFDLAIVTAFSFPESVKLSLLPGQKSRARIAIERVKSFAGPVTLHLQPAQGITFLKTVAVPQGARSVEVAIEIALDAQPRKQGITVLGTANVDGFEESVRGSPVEIEVKKTHMPKKK